ncbi:hypothetical protein [Falsiphaeobacter marinintestinus]|uniref:hypothetical protein n=1 Tax=Falsiphaeobacter marinintestinus TaxID=1492905 RepID=UPI0011B7C0BD|nr:hypothetical protein [Phaeobacter marinintestinus]
MRVIYVALGLVVLGACSPEIPDSGAGFNNSIDAQRAREAALANAGTIQPLTAPLAVSDETLEPAAVSSGVVPHSAPVTAVPLPSSITTQPNTTTANSSSAEDIANDTAAALALASSNSGQAPVQASPSNPAPQSYSNPGISDENDFAAVSSRQSIESDADRIAKNKSQYQLIAPTAVPTRDGASSPNIVQYALATSNPVGARVYSRSGMNLESKAVRNCATFPSPDQAQIAFLEAGGPQKDRRALDPDGDGYACAWDPTPFRRAVQN